MDAWSLSIKRKMADFPGPRRKTPGLFSELQSLKSLVILQHTKPILDKQPHSDIESLPLLQNVHNAP